MLRLGSRLANHFHTFRRNNYYLGRNLYTTTKFAQQTKVELQSNKIEIGEKRYGFVCTNIKTIPEYNMTAILLKHQATKTPYLHLDRDDDNNVFSIGFRTTPNDSRGTPHILEHCVLCGSEKYPVRDPFFKMLNRSLATFMNAMTGPDYTFYPFSSQNKTDFRNLQKVYLDAVFKPNLKYLDFLQEGWRLEHSDLNDKKSDMVFKGVVYNEMKGAFSETSSYFAQKFFNTLLPKGTYSNVYGGNPLEIPNLTYEDLRKFHETYYHPSNAKLYSYGNFPLNDSLKFCSEAYLNNYKYLDNTYSIVQPQERWTEQQKADITCRVDKYGAPIVKQNQIAIGNIVTDITNIHETFLLTALSELMIMGPNSAFYKSLIESNISGGYNALTGYDNQIRDTMFVVGLRDLEQAKFEQVEKIYNETLHKLHENGFDQDHIESVLHGFELSIKHHSPRFGVNMLFNLMPLWNHGGPIIESMQVNKNLERLKSTMKKPGLLQKAIEKYFIDNNHRLIMTMRCDPKFDEVFSEAERKLLASKIEALDENQKEEVFKNGLELAKAQMKSEDLDALPCLKLDEIVLTKTKPVLDQTKSGPIPVQICEGNINGITYFRGVLSFKNLTDSEKLLIPFFNYIADKFDTQGFNYRDFDKFISKSCSGLSFSTHICEHIGNPGFYEQGVVISSHCLDDNLNKMLDIWKEIFQRPCFANDDRLRMLLNNYMSSLNNGIVDSGHMYAMQTAKALISPVDMWKDNLGGIQHITNMQTAYQKEPLDSIRGKIQNIASNLFMGSKLRAAFNYSPTNKTEILRSIDQFFVWLNSKEQKEELNSIEWTAVEEFPKVNRGVHIPLNIPVNFCAKSIPCPSYDNPDYAKLRVLSRFLSSKYLHPVIREKNGAYGTGANVSSEGSFNFYSYRDPNSTATLDVFDEASKWVVANSKLADEQNLFEAKLSILQQMDSPVAEHSKGLDYFLYSLSYDLWKVQREQVMAVNKEDLIEVSEKYLADQQNFGKCVLGSGGDKKFLQTGNYWEVRSGPGGQ